MDENKEVNTTDPKREKVRVIPLSAIDDAPDHPFGVRDDEEMAELVESISTFGVINPVIVRKGEGDRYELISGHRRKYACSKLGIDTLPVIVRDLSREEAIIFMVDSNLQREHILPSERAKAYKMKMEANISHRVAKKPACRIQHSYKCFAVASNIRICLCRHFIQFGSAFTHHFTVAFLCVLRLDGFFDSLFKFAHITFLSYLLSAFIGFRSWSFDRFLYGSILACRFSLLFDTGNLVTNRLSFTILRRGNRFVSFV